MPTSCCVQVIADALRGLTPDKANLLLLSPANEGKCDLKEKWFGTQYSVEGNNLGGHVKKYYNIPSILTIVLSIYL